MRTNEGDLIWRPATDIYETLDAIVVHCDLPGVPKQEINIEMSNDQLIISGNHKGVSGFESASSRVRGIKYIINSWLERRIGKFRKIVRLPSGTESDKIHAKYQDGLLEVTVYNIFN